MMGIATLHAILPSAFRQVARIASVYGLLPFCQRNVLLPNLGTTASVYPASDEALASSHDDFRPCAPDRANGLA